MLTRFKPIKELQPIPVDFNAVVQLIDTFILTDKCKSFLYQHDRKTIGRNHKCPCGSGKRFKNCHMEL